MDKMRENRLGWFGHVMRKLKSEPIRTVMEMSIEGGKGRPKKKWVNTIEEDMMTAGVRVEV